LKLGTAALKIGQRRSLMGSRMNWEIRPMTGEDFDAVLRLWQSTEGVGLNESDTRAGIESFLARNPGLSCVAIRGREIIGAVLCGHDGRRGYLHHLAVAREWRGRGIGRELVNRCVAQLRVLGILKCNVFVFADETEAGSFWEHVCWAPRGDLRVMQRALV
jgi:putative acetyltransferase